MNKSVRALIYATLLIVGLGLLLAGCQPASEPGGSTESAAATDDAGLQAWIDEQIASGENLAITGVIVDGESVSYFAGGTKTPGGEAPDENTQFQMGSITKTFTNMLLAELIAEGKLGYETTLGELMGEDFTFANEGMAGVTVEQLATHTSGLARMPANFAPGDPLDPYRDYTVELLAAEIAQARDKQPLIHKYAYSNLGQGLLGYQLGQLDGSNYTDALTSRVIAPLGLEETGFERSDNIANGYRNGEVVPDWFLPEAFAGAGVLWGSTSDFARLAQVMLGQSESPLKHDITGVRDAVARVNPDFDVSRVWHMAWADDQPIFWHNGGTGGFVSFFGFRPDTNQAVAILVSGGHMPMQKGLEILGSTGLNRPAPPIDTTVFGQYELAPGLGIGVFEQNGLLLGQVTGQPPAQLHAGDGDWYAIGIADASVRFIREDGAVVGLELAQAGVVNPAPKVADEATTAEQTEAEIAPDSLSAYVGEYALTVGAKFTIRDVDGQLTAQLTGQQAFPVFYKGDDVFFYKVVEAELHFERDDAGAVNALVLHQGAIEQRAERIE